MNTYFVRLRASCPLALSLLAALAMLGAFGSDVAVAQTRPALVKDVENPAHSPFWGYGSGTIDVNWVNTQILVGTVPVGKRLVIEHVSVNCTADTDDAFPLVTINVYKQVGMGWSSYSVPIPAVAQGETYDGKASFTVSQSLRLYSDGVDSGTYVNVRHKKTSSTASCWAVVAGYTVDVP